MFYVYKESFIIITGLFSYDKNVSNQPAQTTMTERG